MKREGFIQRIAILLAVIAIGLSTLSCGGGDDGSPGSSEPPLYVGIDTPENVVVQTSEIDLSGGAECDACPPAETGFGYCPAIQAPRPSPTINVTWANRTTGMTGVTNHAITGSCSCLFSHCFTTYSHKWFASVPIAIGENVIQVTASGASSASGTDSITITRVPATADLTAVAGKGQVTLTWQPMPSATTYNLYWSTSRNITKDTGTKITGVSSPYTHVGLSDNVTYYYLLTTVSNDFESFPSNVVWATVSWLVDSVAATLATTETRDTSIATDSAGNAHIYYSFDEHIGTAVLFHNYYVRNVTGVWSSSLAPYTSCINANIALDNQNTVHVIFSDFSVLTHATYVAGAWIPEIVDPNEGCGASLALDSGDKVHLVVPGDNFRYGTNTSGAWVWTVVQSGPAAPDLAVDGAGAAHTLYGGPYPDYGLKYATNKGGVWTVTGVGEGFMRSASLAVDPLGNAHIVYNDNYNRIKYAHNVSGTWAIESIESGGSSYPSIGVDAAGKAHVSYYYDPDRELRYATNSSGSWRTVPIDSVGIALPYSGADSAITLDSQGKVHISYFRGGVLKYATNK